MGQHVHTRVFFTPEVAEEILTRIAEGEPLSRICGPDRESGMPSRKTVHEYLRNDKDFRCAYLIARESQAETLADEVIAIADGLVTQFGQTPNVGRDWLRVSARQWRTSVMAPGTYGKRGVFRDELAELEAEAEEARRPERQMHAAARIVALLEAARRRREDLGQVMTGDLAVDLQAEVPGEGRGLAPTIEWPSRPRCSESAVERLMEWFSADR